MEVGTVVLKRTLQHQLKYMDNGMVEKNKLSQGYLLFVPAAT